MKDWGLKIGLALTVLGGLSACSDAIVLAPKEDVALSSSFLVDGGSSDVQSSMVSLSSEGLSSGVQISSSSTASSTSTKSSQSNQGGDLPAINYGKTLVTGTGAFDFAIKTRYHLSIDRAQSTFTVYDYQCVDGGVLVPNQEDPSLNQYQVEEPYLYMWMDGYCNASQLQGTSSDLIGKWILLPDEVIAPGYTGNDCYLDSSDPDASASLQFGSNEVEVTMVQKDYCWAEDQSGTPIGCNSYMVEDGYGGTATYTLISVGTGSQTIVKSFNRLGSNCIWESEPASPTPASCERAWVEYEAANTTEPFEYDTWIQTAVRNDAKACIGPTGWSGPIDF
jgi:hypothetical protein